MFTGIITHIGTVAERRDTGLRFSVPSNLLAGLTTGASIAINGVCLTVTEIDTAGSRLTVEVMPETLARTTLGSLRPGSRVNLELPLPISGRLDGHFVQGHIDGRGIIRTIAVLGNSHVYEIEIPSELRKYVAEKGSIAVNGVSLTVMRKMPDGFSVGIIPHTWECTTLADLKSGDEVNIETDILAKYVESINNT
ncbi:riboflavin synthase [Patescibacteria group bacterium]|nr:riboflavin synthase [Patescibacteria group bacterium]